MFRFVIAATFAAVCHPVTGATITATITAQNPEIFIGSPGSGTPINAAAITFVSVGTTGGVYSFTNRAYKFDAPIQVTIPGVLSFVSNLPGSGVSTQATDAFPGVFRFSLQETIGPGAQGVFGLDPRVGDYAFAADLGPLQVTSTTSNNASTDGYLVLLLPDGRPINIRLLADTSTLEFDISEDDLAIPVNSPVALVMLVAAIGWWAGVRLMRRGSRVE